MQPYSRPLHALWLVRCYATSIPRISKVRELVERIKLAGQSLQILVLREGEIKKLLA